MYTMLVSGIVGLASVQNKIFNRFRIHFYYLQTDLKILKGDL